MPINPAVRINGKIFGIKEIKIIFKDLNISAIKIDISIIAKAKETKRFLIKNFVPFKNKIALPVISILYLFSGKSSFIFLFRFDFMNSIF